MTRETQTKLNYVNDERSKELRTYISSATYEEHNPKNTEQD